MAGAPCRSRRLPFEAWLRVFIKTLIYVVRLLEDLKWCESNSDKIYGGVVKWGSKVGCDD